MANAGKKTLDRVLSRAGLCSRTEARAAIAAGRVMLNGDPVRDPDAWVDLVRDKVLFDGAPLRAVRRQVWMLHKPVGCVTTAADEHDRATVYALLPADLPWLAPVGRLDQDTSGLLLFTNDSDLANAITAPASKLPKVYEVRCAGQLSADAVRRLAEGVDLDDGRTAPARVQVLAADDHTTSLRLCITEGRNRQVRRMVQAVGSRVLELHRTQVGPLRLGDLAVGIARPLEQPEVAALRAAVSRGPGPPHRRTSRGRAR